MNDVMNCLQGPDCVTEHHLAELLFVVLDTQTAKLNVDDSAQFLDSVQQQVTVLDGRLCRGGQRSKCRVHSWLAYLVQEVLAVWSVGFHDSAHFVNPAVQPS